MCFQRYRYCCAPLLTQQSICLATMINSLRCKQQQSSFILCKQLEIVQKQAIVLLWRTHHISAALNPCIAGLETSHTIIDCAQVCIQVCSMRWISRSTIVNPFCFWHLLQNHAYLYWSCNLLHKNLQVLFISLLCYRHAFIFLMPLTLNVLLMAQCMSPSVLMFCDSDTEKHRALHWAGAEASLSRSTPVRTNSWLCGQSYCINQFLIVSVRQVEEPDYSKCALIRTRCTFDTDNRFIWHSIHNCTCPPWFQPCRQFMASSAYTRETLWHVCDIWRKMGRKSFCSCGAGHASGLDQWRSRHWQWRRNQLADWCQSSCLRVATGISDP